MSAFYFEIEHWSSALQQRLCTSGEFGLNLSDQEIEQCIHEGPLWVESASSDQYARCPLSARCGHAAVTRVSLKASCRTIQAFGDRRRANCKTTICGSSPFSWELETRFRGTAL